ncbi:uncharacterized protein [Venturia canescens]|uniref:uncharacterized protein n=1 Tax=Venturia canescens TaxID=32260 RepID=UPI001C9D569E|nr:uncharacterized protein LOC122418377 [Venturia canescens]
MNNLVHTPNRRLDGLSHSTTARNTVPQNAAPPQSTIPSPDSHGSQTQDDPLNQSLIDFEGADLSNFNNDNNNQVMDIRSARLEPFWVHAPKLWFMSAEAYFQQHRITSDTSKFNAVVTHLGSTVMLQVSDLVEDAPVNDKYLTIKQTLIERFSDSKQKQLNRLLTEMELGDKKPSQLHREMKRLAGDSLSAEALRTLWMQRMPFNVQCSLAAYEDNPLEKLAAIADRMTELTPSPHNHSFAVNAIHKPSAGDTATTDYGQRLGRLEKGLAEVTALLKKNLSVSNTGAKDEESSRQTRTRARSRSRDAAICFFHRRFGPAARRCEKPCVFGPTPSATANTAPQEN